MIFMIIVKTMIKKNKEKRVQGKIKKSMFSAPPFTKIKVHHKIIKNLTCLAKAGVQDKE